MQVTGIRFLPLVAGIVPLLAVTIAHWLGVQNGHLPQCFPYFDGCLSISATGRHPPGSFLFKAIHLPLAAVLLVLWLYTAAWLRLVTDNGAATRIKIIVVCGIIGAVALLVYTTFLGTKEPLYEFMRRFGIYFYFLGTVVAQLLTSLTLLRSRSSNMGRSILAKWMTALTIAPFLLGILNVVLKNTLADADAAENRIEWIAALSMQCWWVLLYYVWRRTGFQATVTTDSTSVGR